MPDPDIQDTGAIPETEPHPAPIFDTGPHPQPLGLSMWSAPGAGADLLDHDCAVALAEPDDFSNFAAPGADEPAASGPAASVVVPGQYRVLKWWKLVLMLAAVWIPAAGIGVGLFSWWYQLLDKTPAVFVVFVYTVACTVSGLMTAMVRNRPLVAALAIALLSAVFASALAAAPLYGHYFCQVQGPCLAGIIPY